MTVVAGEDPRVLESYRAHPLLDPHLPSRRPALARLWLTAWRQLRGDPNAYSRVLGAFSRPFGSTQPVLQSLSSYFRDADAYLDDLLRLVPDPVTRHLEPLPRIREAREMLDLFRLTFEDPDIRTRYEAQRKLYLAKLLFDIDHCRSVRDGPRHRERVEALLREILWKDTEPVEEVEVCCTMRNEGNGTSRFEVGGPPSPDKRCWRFHVLRIPATGGEPAVEIYHYRSRFKREADPATGFRSEDGLLRIAESPRWPELGRRSGSILSKMLRRGIPDPRMVQDLLGAMFIVGNRRQAYALERRLVHGFGGPLRWRDRVDTLAGQRDRAHLDVRSDSGFRVLKEIVDILVEDASSPTPYLFSVEIQIFPIEAYLRTLYDEDFASHTAYKRRQFLHDLVPLLFPAELYGQETILLAETSR